MKFYVCGTHHGTSCTFSERTMHPLWKRSGGDIARCVRHGALIDEEVTAHTIEEARKIVKQQAKS